MTDDEAVAISPDDGSSDRAQSDADQVALISAASDVVDQAAANRTQADADQVITVERLDNLIAASQRLSASAVDVADSTRQEMRTAARARKRFMVTFFLIVLATFSVLIALLLIGVSGARARHELKDCVTPGGKCFQGEQTRATKIVTDLERVTILANACSVDPVLARLTPIMRTSAIRDCIVTGLK